MSRAGVPAGAAGAAVAMYDKLDEQVLGSAAISISFTGIATTNTFFRLNGWIVQVTGVGQPRFRLDGDSGSNYDFEQVVVDDSAVNSSAVTSNSEFRLQSGSTPAGEDSDFEALFAKPIAAQEGMIIVQGGQRSPSTSATQYVAGGRWNNTADLLTQITVFVQNANMDTNTRILLEGAKPA